MRGPSIAQRAGQLARAQPQPATIHRPQGAGSATRLVRAELTSSQQAAEPSLFARATYVEGSPSSVGRDADDTAAELARFVRYAIEDAGL